VREKYYFDWKNKLKKTDYKRTEQGRPGSYVVIGSNCAPSDTGKNPIRSGVLECREKETVWLVAWANSFKWINRPAGSSTIGGCWRWHTICFVLHSLVFVLRRYVYIIKAFLLKSFVFATHSFVNSTTENATNIENDINMYSLACYDICSLANLSRWLVARVTGCRWANLTDTA